MGLLRSSPDPEEKIDEMVDDLRAAREKLGKGDLDAARGHVDGISDGTGCEMCQSLETTLLAGFVFASMAPEGVREMAGVLLDRSMDEYIDLLEEE